ncbi:MAG: DUF2330 domain-containing protein [Myxococcales bacterium]|nr:DUF2330 domain-containing protein [Myxococcales bacterium]
MWKWIGVALLLALVSPAVSAGAFCGFYVAKADTKIFNEASQVVLVRDGDRTVVTMANDFKGAPDEFAVVVPVPTILEEGQIHVGDMALIEHLDAYTAPRLVEYFDTDPCTPMRRRLDMAMSTAPQEARDEAKGLPSSLGVTVEASYTVGEYDIQLLSAEQSDGLETWLRRNGYQLPAGASRVLGSYLKQGMHFFVAKVNLEQKARLGFQSLRPIQMAYESPKFMLPIRLGTLNAEGEQELYVYALSRTGRIETTNYRTVRLPSDVDVPIHVKDRFSDFYRAMFAEQTRRQGGRAVFLEYAWDMNWCDPCAADPLSRDELRGLGVFWLDGGGKGDTKPFAGRVAPGGAQDVFVTRLHVRYDAAHFPEDLVFQETGDRSNFQGRYVLRHAYEGELQCAAADNYRRSLVQRREREAQTLANLTGWEIGAVRAEVARMFPSGGELSEHGTTRADGTNWWRRLWGTER